jgi:hypothetical protein
MRQNGTERRQQRGSRLMRHLSLLPSNNQLSTRNSQVHRFFRQNQTTTQAFLELRKKPNSTHQRMKPERTECTQDFNFQDSNYIFQRAFSQKRKQGGGGTSL